MRNEYPIYYYDQRYKPPKYNWSKIALLVAFIIGVIVVSSSCNTLKQDTKRFDKIEARHPALVAQELTKLFPPTNEQVKKGKVDTIVKHDSTKYETLVKEVDTVFKTINSGATKFQLDSIKAKLQAQIISDCNPFEDDTTFIRIDTLYTLSSENKALIKTQSDTIKSQHDTIIKVTAERDLYDTQSTHKTWWIIALIVGIGIGVFLKIKNIW